MTTINVPIQTREMPEVKPEYSFLRWQAGRYVEERISLPEIPRVFSGFEGVVRRFHLLGFGPTRKDALAMAEALSTTKINKE
jgi:hypothetical protein